MSEARPLEDILRDLYADFSARGDTRAAEQVFGMLVAVVTADELMNAMRRGDDDALRFHTELLNHALESREIPDFHV